MGNQLVSLQHRFLCESEACPKYGHLPPFTNAESATKVTSSKVTAPPHPVPPPLPSPPPPRSPPPPTSHPPEPRSLGGSSSLLRVGHPCQVWLQTSFVTLSAESHAPTNGGGRCSVLDTHVSFRHPCQSVGPSVRWLVILLKLLESKGTRSPMMT